LSYKPIVSPSVKALVCYAAYKEAKYFSGNTRARSVYFVP